jgi:hypothetical protein
VSTRPGPVVESDTERLIQHSMPSLLDCENIILFGFGTGCDSIMSLVNNRGTPFSGCIIPVVLELQSSMIFSVCSQKLKRR